MKKGESLEEYVLRTHKLPPFWSDKLPYRGIPISGKEFHRGLLLIFIGIFMFLAFLIKGIFKERR